MALRGLGQGISMSRGSVTALVDRIESRGYAERMEEGFTEQERAVIACFLTAVTEATHRHARGPARG